MGWRKPWRSLKTRITVVTSVLGLVSLWVLTFTISAWLQADLKSLLSANQISTATMVADQVSSQLAERQAALEFVAQQISPEAMANPARLQAFLTDRPVLGVLFNKGAYVVGVDGVARASLPATLPRVGVNYGQRRNVRVALDQGVASVGEIAVGLTVRNPGFTMAMPITHQGTVIGCLVGTIDLTSPNFLDLLTNNKLGETGGYLLVSRDQRLIVTASDRRRIMEQLAPRGAHPPIDHFLDGAEGATVLVNALGVEVLVAVHQVEGAPWYVAAATPTAEAFGPARVLAERMLGVATLLTLLTAAMNWLFLRRELSPFLSTIRTLSALSESSGPLPSLSVPRNDEIGELIASFNRILRALEEREKDRAQYETMLNRSQRLEGLGLLAGGIAHDFNNLLAGVFGNIELALLMIGDGPGAQPLKKTFGTLNRARSLTQQLITFSKGGDPELKTARLFPFVEDTVRFALSGSTVVCHFDVAPDLLPCRFDRNQVGQVVENLAINAVQAMPQGGTLTVTARNRGSAEAPLVSVSFRDTGVGMSDEVKQHLFEPFFSTKVAGHGLGLTTCYSIVHKHGGTIEVESEVGRGSTFHVSLPAAGEAASVELEPAPAAHHGEGTILIMEDEARVGEVLAELLASLGYRVVRTESGAEAIEALRTEQAEGRTVTAAILDLTIPGCMGGQETLEHLHRLDPGLKAVVSSGFTAAPVLADPLRFGFVAALRKPYRRTDLEQALNVVLRR